MPTETLRADVWVMATAAEVSRARADSAIPSLVAGHWSLLRYPSTEPTADRFAPWYLFDAGSSIHWHEIPIVLTDIGVRPKTMREVREFAARKIPVDVRTGKAWFAVPRRYIVTPESPAEPYQVITTWSLTRSGNAITAIAAGAPVLA